MNEHENCHVEPLEKPLDRAALSKAVAAYLGVSGMGCPRCATRVRNGLLRPDGVLLADVYLERGLALAFYDPEQITISELLLAVTAAGDDGRHRYRAELISQMPVADAIRWRMQRLPLSQVWRDVPIVRLRR
ncbi:MAG: heavy-metal-associated domain-containing protein [Anaerolineae bacterium]